jgi:hypothetical protein
VFPIGFQPEEGVFCYYFINPLTPELNPSAQRCMTRSFTGDILEYCISSTNNPKNAKNYLFILLISRMYGSSYMIGIALPSSGSVSSAF